MTIIEKVFSMANFYLAFMFFWESKGFLLAQLPLKLYLSNLFNQFNSSKNLLYDKSLEVFKYFFVHLIIFSKDELALAANPWDNAVVLNVLHLQTVFLYIEMAGLISCSPYASFNPMPDS